MARTMAFNEDEVRVIKAIFEKILEIDDEDWWADLDGKSFLGLGLRFDVPAVVNELMSEDEKARNRGK